MTDLLMDARGARALAPARRSRRAHRPALSTTAAVAAAFSLSAGLVHLSHAPSHWSLWWAYGAFLLAAGLLQVLLAWILLFKPWRTWVAPSGIAGNVAIIVMYVLSRTPFGAPVGPLRGQAALPGVNDVVTTAAELVAVVALIALLPPRIAGRVATALLAVGIASCLARLLAYVL